MSISPGPEPSLPGPWGEDGVSALVAALDSAPSAVYFLTSAAEPVWANARARAIGSWLRTGSPSRRASASTLSRTGDRSPTW